MDVMVAKHYWNELKRDIPNFYYRINAIENSKTSFGFLLSASETNKTNREIGKFLEKFFDENKDNIDVIVKKSQKYLAKEVNAENFNIVKSYDNVIYLRMVSHINRD